MLSGGEKLWAVQLEPGACFWARLKDQSGQYKYRERLVCGNSWCPLRMRRKAEGRNRARRSGVHVLPIREMSGPAAAHFPVYLSLEAPWGGSLKQTTYKQTNKNGLWPAADTRILILLQI